MRLLLADDHTLIRKGLRSTLLERSNVETVEEASDGESAWKLVRTSQPDICVLDIAMPQINGLELTQRILAFDPKIGIVIYSMHDESHIVRDAMKAGARAYVLKSSDCEQILLAIDAVFQGQSFLSPEITGVAVNELLEARLHTCHLGFGSLTSRERQVLRLVSEGLSSKDIGKRLQLSPKTVDATRRNIMQKMNIYSIAGLTKLAIREGLTSVSR